MPGEMTDSGGRGRTLRIWAGAVVAALWLAVTAAGAVTQENAPGVALALYPANGFAYQQRARATAADGKAAMRDIRITPAALADARAALRREPLASTALALIGLDREAHGPKPEATKIMLAVRALDKRQLLANAWLIAHYGATGDNSDEVMGLLDEALKIRPQLTQQYMPALAQGLTNPDTIPVFQRMLRAKPAWEKDFWHAVASNNVALPNAEVLRGRILAGTTDPGPIDTLLMNAFIAANRMDLALSYAKHLRGLPGDRDNLLRNSSFDAMPLMPPLDWELAGDGRMTAAIDEGRGTLIINAIAGSSGTAARQLFALPPGQYSLLVKLGRADFTRGSDLNVRIHCAESNDETIPAYTERATGDVERLFSVADDSRCRFYWIDLIFSALDSTAPASMSVAEVRIVRARARQETEAPAVVTESSPTE